MDVGVRDLKAHLSGYLQRATSGELITVTDRGRPVAVLGPPLGGIDLAAAIAAGWVAPASRSGLKPVRRAAARSTVLEVLAQDRGE